MARSQQPSQRIDVDGPGASLFVGRVKGATFAACCDVPEPDIPAVDKGETPVVQTETHEESGNADQFLPADRVPEPRGAVPSRAREEVAGVVKSHVHRNILMA